MVRLKITQYPLAMWHQNFFALALAPFGDLAEIHAINEIGDERAFLRVWIHCRDPYRIPDFLVLDFEDKWVQCPVVIETWYSIGLPPPEDPLPSILPPGRDQQLGQGSVTARDRPIPHNI
jgi:hypothetical protein